MRRRGPKPKREAVAWSSNMAYAVGLIVTDGNLSSSGRHVSLTSKDREQLENFMVCIEKRAKIGTKRSTYTDKLITHVQFGDVTLYRFLVSIGLMPNKTKIIGAVAVPDEHFFDFLRGHLDGDGCFYSYFDQRWRSSFMFYLNFVSASGTHIDWLRDTIERLSGVKGHKIFTGRKGHETHGLRYAKAETMVLLRKMYPTKDKICLSRKRLKIEDALRIVGESL